MTAGATADVLGPSAERDSEQVAQGGNRAAGHLRLFRAAGDLPSFASRCGSERHRAIRPGIAAPVECNESSFTLLPVGPPPRSRTARRSTRSPGPGVPRRPRPAGRSCSTAAYTQSLGLRGLSRPSFDRRRRTEPALSPSCGPTYRALGAPTVGAPSRAHRTWRGAYPRPSLARAKPRVGPSPGARPSRLIRPALSASDHSASPPTRAGPRGLDGFGEPAKRQAGRSVDARGRPTPGP